LNVAIQAIKGFLSQEGKGSTAGKPESSQSNPLETDRSERTTAQAIRKDRPLVFISYSHESDEHAARVRGLTASLARDGCDCRLDVHKDTDEDWPLWMKNQLLVTDFILCVVTPAYTLRFDDRELPDVGRGVGWEAGLIRRLLYNSKLRNKRIFPVIFDSLLFNHIPLELQGYAPFVLDSEAGYETLLRKLLNRPLYLPTPFGSAPHLPATVIEPLFSRPGQ